MAADLALLDAVAAGGPPALRVYQWSPPALSLGRFQPEDDVDHDACRRAGVEVVRRPTGGRALLHGGDLTYAVAVRPPRDVAAVGRGGLPLARAGADRGAGPTRCRRRQRPARRSRRAGVLRRPAGGRSAGGGAQALWVGPGAAGRRGAPARVDPVPVA